MISMQKQWDIYYKQNQHSLQQTNTYTLLFPKFFSSVIFVHQIYASINWMLSIKLDCLLKCTQNHSHRQTVCPEVPSWWLDHDDGRTRNPLVARTWERTFVAALSILSWSPVHETKATKNKWRENFNSFATQLLSTHTPHPNKKTHVVLQSNFWQQ